MTLLLEDITQEQLAEFRADFLPKPERIFEGIEIYREIDRTVSEDLSLESRRKLRAKGVVFYYFDRDERMIYFGVEEEAYKDIWSIGISPFEPKELLPRLSSSKTPVFDNQSLMTHIRGNLSRESKKISTRPKICKFRPDPNNTILNEIVMVLVGIDCTEDYQSNL